MIYPVITLWQPWASLCFADLGGMGPVKQHETRGWPFPDRLRGLRFAIHAALKRVQPEHEVLRALCDHLFQEPTPLGAIIGTAVVNHCYLCTPPKIAQATTLDMVCGDWSHGRYLWLLEDTRLLPRPIPAKGRQGWWAHELPDGS